VDNRRLEFTLGLELATIISHMAYFRAIPSFLSPTCRRTESLLETDTCALESEFASSHCPESLLWETAPHFNTLR
jgi:hypothetical protein